MAEHPVALLAIALGLLAIVARGPLLFAPAPTLALYRRALATPGRVRAFGLGFAVLGALMIGAATGDDTTLGKVILVIGWPVALGAGGLLLLFPDAYRRFTDAFLQSADNPSGRALLRVLGLAGISLGLALVFFGLRAL
jgi:uncharacterized protein YjeT (DUF2065 family)